MATTTNYNWSTPDDTSLVKDGAAAIRTLGSSIDTTTKALNPSTTLGDIEYRSSTANTNTRLGIGSTGQVLTVSGGVPAWATPAGSTFVGCSLENGSTTISNNTDTILTFSGELYDTDAMHSTSSNTSRITIPTGKGGYYDIRWSMVWDNNSSGNRRIRLLKNGSSYEFGPILTIKGDGLTGLSNSTVVSTSAGDYWELQAFQDSGGSLNVGIGGSLMFQANKVG